MCDIHASCKNLNGTFECRCNEGYKGDGFKCTKLDLTDLPQTSTKLPLTTSIVLGCRQNPSICHPNAQCLPQFNRCECYYGFEGDGISQCRRRVTYSNNPISSTSTTQKITISVNSAKPDNNLHWQITNTTTEAIITTYKNTPQYIENRQPTTTYPVYTQTTKNSLPSENYSVYGKRCGVAICHPLATCDTQRNVCKCNYGFDGDGYYNCE